MAAAMVLIAVTVAIVGELIWHCPGEMAACLNGPNGFANRDGARRDPSACGHRGNRMRRGALRREPRRNEPSMPGFILNRQLTY